MAGVVRRHRLGVVAGTSGARGGLPREGRAPWRLADPARLLVELGLFAAATAGIAATAGPVLAAGFVVVVVVNVALMFVWAQRQTT
ncbi:DUF2568 domain-containing protein [Pseudonocardia broussonetiae]|uniref:DUF2568 domain-containing protein n=1 Tax=Pseudonocardia broussonetiae TaxID=2736640 RepID=A0A6M6JQV6_9PSEU|nr:DUF2568 domain-containing protein [Pseudonocardia broussonetiae]QJY49012.1 DUF2568 domain-containing protein [Pseudonocardia broussonetiae]